MAAKAPLALVAYSPGEFAELFGKSQTWGYRQIYAGKVKTITEHGRILIPAAEVEAILKTAGIYDGIKPGTLKTKSDLQALAPQLPHAWRAFLAARRQQTPPTKFSSPSTAAKKWPSSPAARQAAMIRLSRRKS